MVTSCTSDRGVNDGKRSCDCNALLLLLVVLLVADDCTFLRWR